MYGFHRQASDCCQQAVALQNIRLGFMAHLRSLLELRHEPGGILLLQHCHHVVIKALLECEMCSPQNSSHLLITGCVFQNAKIGCKMTRLILCHDFHRG